MINLLPSELKTMRSYARRNAILIKWLSASGVGLIGVVAIVLFGSVYINRQVNLYEKNNQVIQSQLDSQNLAETQKKVSQISDSIKLVNQVLARQIRFSGLLKQISVVTPPGAVLQNLSITKAEGGIDLQVIATSYEAAAQMQVNLSDPENKLFSKADIVNIACSVPSPQDTNPYVCQMTLRAEFSKNNPYRVVQSGATQ